MGTLMALILTAWMSFADIKAVMEARSVAELVAADRKESHIEVLRRRCDEELKSSYVPIHCFQWVEKAPLNSEQKTYLRQWFDESCVRVLRRDLDSPQHHFRSVDKFGPLCRREMKQWMRIWAYRAKKEAGEELLGKFKVGSQFELYKRDEKIPPKRPNQINSARTLR